MSSWDVFYGGKPVSILNEAECIEIANKVRSAEDIWVMREILPNHPVKFHTLGAATYLDSDSGIYEKHIADSVDRMHNLFDDLYLVLCERMGIALGASVEVADDLAPPGFHIYRGSPFVEAGFIHGGSVHVDRPDEAHIDKYPNIEATLSFTLPVELPKASIAGMYYWMREGAPFSWDDLAHFAPMMEHNHFRWLEDNKRAVYYNLGNIFMHDGTTLHQLASMCKTDEDDYRITLQGHGIFVNGCWLIYF